ncbi:hypothetical protein DL96DRAFT_1635691 [Flagelloscypha sp. PMI_526]|nr:hypothetical protein DL96DRAFT_1635691 [Flagelloscypha sp. PMI_526]
MCLAFEVHSLAAGEAGAIGLRHARVLGHLVLHAPSQTARTEVAKVINSCLGDYSLLSDLGETFVDYFIFSFKRYKGRTPASNSPPDGPYFEAYKSRLLTSISTPPTTHIEAKSQALIRDAFRCVVSGKYDRVAPVSGDIKRAAGGGVYTELAHIIPESTYFDVNKSPKKSDYSSSVMAVLKSFGYDIPGLHGPKIHSLCNVMTVSKDDHDFFERLELWFEKTETPNCYSCQKSVACILAPEFVTFTTPDPINLPLPSPDLLTLHGVCAKVAHLSGAGEYVDGVLEDLEHLDVLATDGTSFDLLYHALASTSHR